MRFGNKSFRTWYEKVKDNLETELFDQMLSTDQLKAARIELYPYLLDSFGSYEWIDYGTGHEMNFLVFLYCLYWISIYSKEDLQGVALKIFNKYLLVMRKLQIIYNLEPAGSHGVWGLDDYQHIAFIIGAGQLAG